MIECRPTTLYNVTQNDTSFSPSRLQPDDTSIIIKYFYSESILSNKYENKNLGEPKPKEFVIDTIKNWASSVDLSHLSSFYASYYNPRPSYTYYRRSDYSYGSAWDTIPSNNYLCIKQNYKGVNKYGWILFNNWKVIGCALQK